MKNSTKVSLLFHFKGEAFSPEAVIDLDMYIQAQKDEKYIYDVLAKSIGMDEHRHEYDVMVMADIIYSEPKGIAEAFAQDGNMDWTGLEKAYQEQAESKAITDLASSHFSAEELEANPKLLAALTQAYKQNNK